MLYCVGYGLASHGEIAKLRHCASLVMIEYYANLYSVMVEEVGGVPAIWIMTMTKWIERKI